MPYDAAPTQNQIARPVRMRLIDTERYPEEAVLYGDEIQCWSERTRDGQRFITLIGPDGSLELHESCWANIFRAMEIA
jgi:hypothetical protein